MGSVVYPNSWSLPAELSSDSRVQKRPSLIHKDHTPYWAPLKNTLYNSYYYSESNSDVTSGRNFFQRVQNYASRPWRMLTSVGGERRSLGLLAACFLVLCITLETSHVESEKQVAAGFEAVPSLWIVSSSFACVALAASLFGV
ncbi:hypothetical protein BDR26DRAFT_850058 [Obelidium mucronatum]|nr:hypothetical protein BDR26DRAFT_850058 [Obelidium mucronatum]